MTPLFQTAGGGNDDDTIIGTAGKRHHRGNQGNDKLSAAGDDTFKVYGNAGLTRSMAATATTPGHPIQAGLQNIDNDDTLHPATTYGLSRGRRWSISRSTDG